MIARNGKLVSEGQDRSRMHTIETAMVADRKRLQDSEHLMETLKASAPFFLMAGTNVGPVCLVPSVC